MQPVTVVVDLAFTNSVFTIQDPPGRTMDDRTSRWERLGRAHGSAQRSEQADGGGLTVWPVAAAWPWPWAFVRATVREHVRRSVRAVGTGRATAGPEGVGRIGAPSHETSAGLRQHSAAA
jgi:hypothetical protein